MRLRHIAIATLFAAMLTACSGSEGETLEFTETVDRIVATTGDGLISIVGDVDATRTEVETIASFSGDEPAISVTLDAGVLTIDDGCGDRNDCEVEFLVSIPAAVDVAVTADAGSVIISNTIGVVEVATVSGAISLNGIEGDLRLIETTSGSILGARLEASQAVVVGGTDTVDLTFDEPVDRVTVTTTSGDATVQVAGEPYNVVTSTDTGSIDIVVDEDPNSGRTIEVMTGSGDIKVYRK